MKHGMAVMVLAWAGLLVFSTPSHASFEDTESGARAAGLGGAFAALSDDVHALSCNPAGLVYLRRKEFSATYGLLHTGLSDGSKVTNSFVGYGQPISDKMGSAGLSWKQLNVSDLYQERAVTMGYAYRLSQRWAAGLNVKHLYRQFSAPTGQTSNLGIVNPNASDPLFASGDSKSAVGLDAGVLFRPYRNYAVGFAAQNANEPNMSISDKDRDVIPMTLRTGIAYNEHTLTLLGELDTRQAFSGKRDYFFTAAAEKWWLGAGFAQADLAFRGSLAFGSRSFSQFTMGVSYRLSGVQMDYAFVMPMGGVTFGSTQGSHRMTFTLRFGRTIAEPDYETRMRSAEIAAKKATEELEMERKESERLAAELEALRLESDKRKAVIEETRQRSGREAAFKEAQERYAESMDQYWKRKAAGAAINERIGLLSQILRESAGTGVNVSQAEKELAVAKSDRAKSEVDLAVSWSYYQKIVARGASVPERIQLLSRMIERFSRSGVDMTNLRVELNSLQGR